MPLRFIFLRLSFRACAFFFRNDRANCSSRLASSFLLSYTPSVSTLFYGTTAFADSVTDPSVSARGRRTGHVQTGVGIALDSIPQGFGLTKTQRELSDSAPWC